MNISFVERAINETASPIELSFLLTGPKIEKVEASLLIDKILPK